MPERSGTAAAGPPGHRPAESDRQARRPVTLILGAGILVAALLATLLWRPSPRLVWNASASSPIGLYLVRGADHIRPGETAIAWPPGTARRLGAARGYLPANVPLVKPVAAAAGDRVCARGAAVYVNGRQVAARRRADPSGRALPWWSGCERLGGGDLLLLSAQAPQAFDGRYFGVSRRPLIVGRASLLWPR